jgi:hypothetical protein
MTLYGMDDDISDNGGDMVIGSEHKLKRGPGSPVSCSQSFTGKKERYLDDNELQPGTTQQLMEQFAEIYSEI